MTFLRRGVVAIACAALAVTAFGPAASGAETPSPEPTTGTVVVQAATDEDLLREASLRVAQMSTREKAASVVMGHIPSTDPGTLRQYMQSTGIGGFILMGANIPGSEDRLRELTAAMTIDPALPPLLSIDQEGGDVSRLPWDDFPSSVTLKDEPPAAAQSAFAGRGALVQRAGIGVNFGIVADVTEDRSMFIYRRALGTTPQSGAERVSAAVTGEGISAYSTLKHFPGHGAAPGDSHSGVPSTGMSKADWAASDAIPFAAGIDASAPVLMYGHLAYTAVDAAPASMSAEWHRIAREELGFTGLSITDDLGMLQASGIPAYRDPVANAITALAAGNDMVLAIMFSDAGSAGRITDGITAAADAGTLPMERLDDAATKVMVLRLQLAAEGRGLMPCTGCEAAG